MSKFEVRKPYCVEQVEEIANVLKKSKEREIKNNFAKIDFVKTLTKIKEYCDSVCICDACKFRTRRSSPSNCQLQELFCELYKYPHEWDIEKIKEILDE